MSEQQKLCDGMRNVYGTREWLLNQGRGAQNIYNTGTPEWREWQALNSALAIQRAGQADGAAYQPAPGSSLVDLAGLSPSQSLTQSVPQEPVGFDEPGPNGSIGSRIVQFLQSLARRTAFVLFPRRPPEQ